MFRKSLIAVLVIGIVITIGRVTIIAQTAVTSGKVELESADGTKKPVVGAVIDIYRTDIKGGVPSAKTNKRGEFAIAGLMLGGEYTFSVSAPGAAPMLQYKVKAGQENIVITLSPGDGRKYTEQEARQAASSAKGATVPEEMSPEEKKARADLEAKNKEITAKNEKIEKANQIIARANKEGNEAYNAKDYDLAIAKFQEGLDADPDFIGSAPIFYNNRSAALMARAVNTYNKMVKVTDATEKVAGLTLVKKDLADAISGYMKSWTMLKAATPEPSEKPGVEAKKLEALKGVKDALSKTTLMAQVEPSAVDAAKLLLPEYMAIETDAAKKVEASLILPRMYEILQDTASAVAAYKQVLETSPDNIDALAGAGLNLVSLGYINNNNKEQMQEGTNLLQRFLDLAPDTHKFKQDVTATIANLKKEQNVAPQKSPAKKKN